MQRYNNLFSFSLFSQSKKLNFKLIHFDIIFPLWYVGEYNTCGVYGTRNSSYGRWLAQRYKFGRSRTRAQVQKKSRKRGHVFDSGSANGECKLQIKEL